jgi:hypothetical protein
MVHDRCPGAGTAQHRDSVSDKAGFDSCWWQVAVAAVSILALAGCGMSPLDPARRHLVTVGTGGASLNDSRMDLELGGGWNLNGA